MVTKPTLKGGENILANIQRRLRGAVPLDSNTVIEKAYNAIIGNNFDDLKQLKIKNGHMVFLNHGEQLAIALAIKQKNVEIINYLLKKGALPVDHDCGPLCIAVEKPDADIEIVDLILNELTKDLTNNQKKNFSEEYNLASYDETRYNEAKVSNINFGFIKAGLVGRKDILNLFMNKKVIDLTDEDIAVNTLNTLLKIWGEPQTDRDQRPPGSVVDRDTLYEIIEYILAMFVQSGADLDKIEARIEDIETFKQMLPKLIETMRVGGARKRRKSSKKQSKKRNLVKSKRRKTNKRK